MITPEGETFESMTSRPPAGVPGLEEPLALAEDDRERPDVELVDQPVGVQRLDEVGAALDLDLGTVLRLDGVDGVGQRAL